jgi:hypothetical protein
MSPEEWERLNAKQKAANPKLGTKQKMLSTVAQLVPWGTPNTMDSMESRDLEARKTKGGCSNLKDQVTMLAGWRTPIEGDTHGQKRGEGKGPPSMLCGQVVLVLASGPTPDGSTAPATGNGGQLNPAFTRWLQGFPETWDVAAIRAHRWMRMPRRKQGT